MNLIEAVRSHALANYTKGGWDYVVECWSDDDIREAIGKARTASGAIAKIRATVGIVDERRREVRAEAGADLMSDRDIARQMAADDETRIAAEHHARYCETCFEQGPGYCSDTRPAGEP